LWFNTSMWTEYITPLTLKETLQLLASRREKARLVAGATDLMLELERGARKNVNTLLDITRLPSLDKIKLDEDGVVHIGALVTHNDVAASHLLRAGAFPLVTCCVPALSRWSARAGRWARRRSATAPPWLVTW
jgi:CO/xanthine dehydrogenase FAD-binding subunit